MLLELFVAEMEFSFSPDDLRDELSPTREAGGYAGTVTGIAALDRARAGELSFLGNPKYRSRVGETQASVVLVPLDFEGAPGPDQLFLYVESPSAALGKLCERIEARMPPPVPPGIHPTAWIDEDVQIGDEVTIEPFCSVGRGVRLGARTRLHSHVVIGPGSVLGEDCDIAARAVITGAAELGHRVRVLPGGVVGSEGFGYDPAAGTPQRLPQIGKVILEDEVEIGANTTIDRARFEATVIGAGTKIDNLVQIAHNVRLGKGCLLAAQVGIAGSTTIGDHVMIAGQAGIAGHVEIGDRAVIGGQCAVIGNVDAGAYVNGSPYMPQKQLYRLEVLKRRLPDLFARVGKLEEAFQTTAPHES